MTEQDNHYASGCFAFYFLWIIWAVIILSAVSFISKITSALFPKTGGSAASIVWLVGIFGFLKLMNILDQFGQNRWPFYHHLHEIIKEYQRQNEQAQKTKFNIFDRIFRNKKNEK